MVHYINGRRLELRIADDGSIDAAAIRYIAQADIDSPGPTLSGSTPCSTEGASHA